MNKNILIIYNKYNEEAVKASRFLEKYCDNKKIKYKTCDGWDLHFFKLNKKEYSVDYDLAVVLGGDGTMLRTSHFFAEKNTPILGVNYGHLGFLTNSSKYGLEKLLNLALDGKLQTEIRCHLIIEVKTDSSNYKFVALNEVSVRRSKSGRIVEFSMNINNEHVCNYRSDGVIASTATGSTAYALAAGGPLVAPSYKGVIIVPLAPHTLNSRPLVTDVKDIVEFDFMRDAKMDKLAVTIDGVIKKIDGKIQTVVVSVDNNKTTILRYNDDTFYSRISKVFF